MKKIIWEEKTRKDWDQAKILLAEQEPFFAHVAYSLAERDIPFGTLATDGRHLFVNPDFVKGSIRYEQAFFRLHEIAHCVLKHPIRMASDWKHLRREILLQATDHVVNLWLKKCVIQGSGGGTGWIPQNVWTQLTDKKNPKAPLCDDRFEGMSTMEVYRILDQEQPKSGKGQAQKPQKGPTSGSPPGGGGGQAEPDASGSPQDDDGGGGGGQSPPDGQDAAGSGRDCCRAAEGEGGGQPSQAELEEMETAIDEAVVQAHKLARSRGKVPHGAERLVDEIIHPREDPLEKLRRLFGGSIKDDYTWTRPNRKHIGRGVYLPSMRRTGIGRIAFAVDTSGSMHPDELKLAWGTVQEVLANKAPEKLYLIFTDAAVAHVEEVQATDEIDFKACGGGGTDFKPVFDWLKDNNDVDVLVYFTDMECPAADLVDPGIPVFWVCCRDLTTVNESWKPRFGEIITVTPRVK